MSVTLATELDLESFLDHSTKASGSGFLANWKEDGQIRIWIHPTAAVYSLWSHTWYKYVEQEDEKTKEKYWAIRRQRINCLEQEKLLKKQRWREDNGSRTAPPQICPFDKCIEWVREQIDNNSLKWSEPIFKFGVESDIPGDETEDVIIYAGGFTGLFQKRELTKDEQAELRKAGIKQSEAYKQNGYARQQYAMAVLAESDIDAGWVIALEGQTLGDKLKKAIRDEVRRCGGSMEDGHPKYNPYPFEWTYDENKQFSEKYDVVALSRQRPSDQVQTALEDEHPSFEQLLAQPKLGSLHKSMKEAACIEMPFDSFFEKASEVYGMEEEEDDELEAPESLPVPEVSSPVVAELEGTETGGEGEETIDCDVCSQPMGPEETVCGSCGAVYAVNDAGDYYLASRACGNCKEPVKVNEDGCGKCDACGATHSEDWSFAVPAKKPARRKAVSKKAPKHADARQSRRSKARAVSSKG